LFFIITKDYLVKHVEPYIVYFQEKINVITVRNTAKVTTKMMKIVVAIIWKRMGTRTILK